LLVLKTERRIARQAELKTIIVTLADLGLHKLALDDGRTVYGGDLGPGNP
jgi:hypothetical protein